VRPARGRPFGASGRSGIGRVRGGPNLIERRLTSSLASLPAKKAGSKKRFTLRAVFEQVRLNGIWIKQPPPGGMLGHRRCV
jgi:hypothetical protein